MAGRGPDWAAWVDWLPALTREVVALWQLRPDGPWTHG
jgi:streptomycin 6-kinase